jgi:hypothetical protein
MSAHPARLRRTKPKTAVREQKVVMADVISSAKWAQISVWVRTPKHVKIAAQTAPHPSPPNKFPCYIWDL